jgi:hypothetical protein
MEKIIRFGVGEYFALAEPLHLRQAEICEQMQRAASVAEIRQLNDQFLQISAQLDAIGEPKQ